MSAPLQTDGVKGKAGWSKQTWFCPDINAKKKKGIRPLGLSYKEDRQIPTASEECCDKKCLYEKQEAQILHKGFCGETWKAFTELLKKRRLMKPIV